MTLMRRQPASFTRSPALVPFGFGGSNWGSLSGFLQDFDRLWNETASAVFDQTGQYGSYPVDLYETGEALVLEMAVPGIEANDLDISIEGRQLTIRGQFPVADNAHERRYWVQTIPHGEFTRTLTLPVAVQADNIHAQAHSGLLVLTMPKVAEAQARRISIQPA